jgi:hypothetical protein
MPKQQPQKVRRRAPPSARPAPAPQQPMANQAAVMSLLAALGPGRSVQPMPQALPQPSLPVRQIARVVPMRPAPRRGLGLLGTRPSPYDYS